MCKKDTNKVCHTSDSVYNDYTMKNEIEKIAAQILGIETLETRKMDSLDFSDQAVWQIKEALEAAYNAGRLHSVRKATNAKTGKNYYVAAK